LIVNSFVAVGVGFVSVAAGGWEMASCRWSDMSKSVTALPLVLQLLLSTSHHAGYSCDEVIVNEETLVPLFDVSLQFADL